MAQQLGRAARQVAVQVCSAGRPALYKLKQQQQNLQSRQDADPMRLIRLAIGESGLRQVGEDALFVRHLLPAAGGSGAGVVSFGVADGVGGWRDQGVDPSRASMALLGACSEGVAAAAGADAATPSLKSVLASAHRSLLTEQRDLIGSTTVCFARLAAATGQLEVANLGDSGLCVLNADFQLKMRTKFQANMGGVFNCPMQLAFPSALSNQYPKAEDCELYSLTMEPGDIAMVATDGVWDNLYQQTIEEIFRHAFQQSRAKPLDTESSASETNASEKQQPPQEPLEAAAQLLVDAATHLSAEESYFSPFCHSAKAAGLKYSGGKEDDMSLVLARMCPLPQQQGDNEEPPPAKL